MEEKRLFQNTYYKFTDKQKLIQLSDNHIWQVESQNSTFLFWCHLCSQTTSNYERHFSENLQYELFNDCLWKTGTLTCNKSLLTDVNQYVPVPYKRLKWNRQTDFKQLTTDGSKPTNDWWQTLHESCSQYHQGFTDQSLLTDQTANTIDWQALSRDLLLTKK